MFKSVCFAFACKRITTPYSLSFGEGWGEVLLLHQLPVQPFAFFCNNYQIVITRVSLLHIYFGMVLQGILFMEKPARTIVYLHAASLSHSRAPKLHIQLILHRIREYTDIIS